MIASSDGDEAATVIGSPKVHFETFGNPSCSVCRTIPSSVLRS